MVTLIRKEEWLMSKAGFLVMDRKKVANTIHTCLDAEMDLLKKGALDSDDKIKLKVLKTTSSHLNVAVSMIQQETMQQKVILLTERMKEINPKYTPPKSLTALTA